VDPAAGKDVVVVTAPGYTVPARGATWAEARIERLPLAAERDYLPDLAAVPAEVWRRAALVWTNYPNNPTGAVAPLDLHEELAELAREHGFVYASDEAYVEIYFDEPPASALQVSDRTNVLSVHTLSKRSSMTGYRSGFVAGDPDLVAGLRRIRPSVGVTPQEFVQRAAVAAWNDDAHVATLREGYAKKRALFVDLLERHGIRVEGSAATFYVWFAVPDGSTSEEFAMRLLERGIVVAPGSYFGPEGEGYIRMAMVPTFAECERAAGIMEELLG
jgi:acetylornithine aminotransferase